MFDENVHVLNNVLPLAVRDKKNKKEKKMKGTKEKGFFPQSSQEVDFFETKTWKKLPRKKKNFQTKISHGN